MQDDIVVSNKFTKAEREIELLRSEMHQQLGVWIFKRHTYSASVLRESKHFRKVYSYVDKIGDDISHWRQAGTLSEEGLDAYRRGRERVLRKLRAAKKEIEERNPTLWEKIFPAFDGFVKMVAKAMPTITELLAYVVPLLAPVPDASTFLLLPEPSGDVVSDF